MKINKENLIKLDNIKEMIPLTFDPVFKGVFSRNLEILKEFLVDVLHLEYELEELDIKILNNELIKENIGEYQKRIDINIVINDNIYVEIEINRENFKRVKYRNKMYQDKLSSLLLETGDNINKLEEIYFYQLNLNTEDKNEKIGEHIIVPYDISSNEIYMNNNKTILKYLEFYYQLYYNKPSKRTRDIIWLAALSSKTFTELYTILKDVLDDKSLKKFIKDVINMNWDKLEGFSIHEWEKEKWDKYLEEKRKEEEEKRLEDAIEQGIEQGIEKGIEQGIKLGSKETLVNTVKEMLKNDASIEFISKVTKLSNKEIKKIEESITD